MRTSHTCLSFLALIVVFVSLPRGTDAFSNTTSTTQSSSIGVDSSSLTPSNLPSTTTSQWSSSSNATATTTSMTLTTSITLSTASSSSSSQQLSSNTTYTLSTSTWASASNTTTRATATRSAGNTTTISAASASATVILAPAVHWDHDPNDINHVVPQPSGRFYYAETPGAMDPNVAGQFAQVTSNFTNPTVVLEHSGHIDKVTCGPSPADPSTIELAVSFSTLQGYQSAKTNWTLHADLVLITYIPGCGVEDGDQRAFWKTSKLRFDDNGQNIFASAKEIQLKDAVKEMDLEWGHYTPPAADNNTFIVVASDNSTRTTTCGAPSGPVVDGLPAAPCGPNFDHTLDDSIGYINATSVDAGDVAKRCKWYQVACLAREAWEAAQKLIHKYDPHWDPSVSKDVSFGLGPPSSKLVSTPFGNAYKLASYGSSPNYVNAYCVDCGVNGNVKFTGKASLALLEGVRSAEVGISGHLYAGVFLGIDAKGSVGSKSYNQPLWSAGIPVLSVPGIYTIGPMVSVGAELSLNLEAGGQVLLGASMDWPAFSVTMDLVHGKNSRSSGLTPTLTRKFQAGGQVKGTANMGFPIAIGIGLDIPVISFHKALELVDRPGIEASVSFTAGKNFAGVTSTCDNGISAISYFTNDVYLSVFDIKRWNIWNYKSTPFWRFCFHIFKRDDAGIEEAPKAIKLRRSSTRRELANATSEANSTSIDLPAGSFNETAFITPPPDGINDTNATSVLAPAGSAFIPIVDVNSAYQLSAPSDGNLYLDNNGGPAGSLFALSENVTLADSIGRGFHYYKDVMSKYGVSRFRLSDVANMPQTAVMAALVLLGDADGKYNGHSVFGVVDSDGAINFPVVCSIVGQLSKLFLVKDIDAGIQTLLKSELRNTVTGGEVSKCAFIPLTPGMAVPAA